MYIADRVNCYTYKGQQTIEKRKLVSVDERFADYAVADSEMAAMQQKDCVSCGLYVIKHAQRYVESFELENRKDGDMSLNPSTYHKELLASIQEDGRALADIKLSIEAGSQQVAKEIGRQRALKVEL
ncbi:uncharacterized protein [Watersipora subatra]|uniref:uncharacterized protein isoform X2 n=1 Tax=Watersipora subatra TaxID=2589382 RepID=UPI00355B3E00